MTTKSIRMYLFINLFQLAKLKPCYMSIHNKMGLHLALFSESKAIGIWLRLSYMNRVECRAEPDIYTL